jgi:hypothetical protein
MLITFALKLECVIFLRGFLLDLIYQYLCFFLYAS